MEFILLFVALFSIVVYLYYYKNYFRAFLKLINNPTAQREPVSIVLCIHGEEPHFQKYLPKIISQKYPEYELIIVSKQISESNFFFISSVVATNDFVKHISLDYGNFPFLGKKQALHQGIMSAKYDIIVTIDADAYPEDETWLENIAGAMDVDTAIVIGVSPYIRQKSWINRWIRYDAMQGAQMYLSFAAKGSPYMAVGRNMAFKKELWSEAYLEKYKDAASGDDDCLVLFHKDKKCAIQTETKVFSYPKLSFREWILQKLRHLNTGILYPKSTLRSLGFMPLSTLLFYGSIWLWLSFFKTHYGILVLILFYWLIKMLSVYQFEKKIQLKNKTWKYVPMFDVLYALALIILPIFALLYKPKWK